MSRAAKLLIVEDNPVVRSGFAALLQSHGFEVLEAGNAHEGLQQARCHRPDLILLDVILPDTNGIELCRQLKADRDLKSLFVVLVSSVQTAPGSQASGLDAGADGYIARPVDNQELLARVHSLLRIQRAEAALRKSHTELEQRVQERTAELACANARLRAMSLRLVDLQEAERRFLARELHDEVGQIVTGLKMTMERALDPATQSWRILISEAMGLVDSLLAQLRRLSLELRPPILDDLGLVVALDWYIGRYRKQTSIHVDFRQTPNFRRLPAILETALFRTVQEALTNIARHAGTNQAVVRLWMDPQRVGVQVQDHGRGFDVAAALASSSTVGLGGMKERVELLRGDWVVESKPGSGTLLTVEIPLRFEEIPPVSSPAER
jgi:signal transduction histidine kinase